MLSRSKISISSHLGRCRFILVALVFICDLFFLPAQVVHAEDQRFDEYQVKAAFLYNLTNFVFWSNNDVNTPSGPFVITLLGRDSFGVALDKIVAGERVASRPIEIRRLQRIDELTPCQVIFLSESFVSDPAKFSQILDFANRYNVLTVGESAAFLQGGGAVALIFRDNRVRVGINITAANRAGLQFSSKLLQVATIVGSE